MSISFNNPPAQVSDPRNPNKPVPAPKDWVSWYQEHPYLDTSSPSRRASGASRGGASPRWPPPCPRTTTVRTA